MGLHCLSLDLGIILIQSPLRTVGISVGEGWLFRPVEPRRGDPGSSSSSLLSGYLFGYLKHIPLSPQSLVWGSADFPKGHPVCADDPVRVMGGRELGTKDQLVPGQPGLSKTLP